MINRLAQIESMLASDPEDSFLRFALAKELEKNGKNERSLEVFDSLILSHPEYIGAYYHFAQLLIQTDHPLKAKIILQQGIEESQKASDQHAKNELLGLRALNFEEE